MIPFQKESQTVKLTIPFPKESDRQITIPASQQVSQTGNTYNASPTTIRQVTDNTSPTNITDR